MNIFFKSFLEYEFRSNMRYVRIYFDTPTFDKIAKDKASKWVYKLSAIGGTMGLLTGFSIISGVEIIYLIVKIAFLSIIKLKYCINNKNIQ